MGGREGGDRGQGTGLRRTQRGGWRDERKEKRGGGRWFASSMDVYVTIEGGGVSTCMCLCVGVWVWVCVCGYVCVWATGLSIPLTCRPSLAAAYESSGRARERKKRVLTAFCDTLKHSPHLHYRMTVDLDNFVLVL